MQYSTCRYYAELAPQFSSETATRGQHRALVRDRATRRHALRHVLHPMLVPQRRSCLCTSKRSTPSNVLRKPCYVNRIPADGKPPHVAFMMRCDGCSGGGAWFCFECMRKFSEAILVTARTHKPNKFKYRVRTRNALRRHSLRVLCTMRHWMAGTCCWMFAARRWPSGRS